MQKIKLNLAYYTTKRRSRQLVLPLNVEEIIPMNDPVVLLDEVLEELDYTSLHRLYSSRGRKSLVEPINMFKVVVLAMTQGVYSLRDIADRCVNDRRYIWLLQGVRAPSFMTIGRFFQRMTTDVLEDLFAQFLNVLASIDSITFEEIYVDGTKIEANANRYSFVWRKNIERNLQKLKVQFKGIQSLVEKELKIQTGNLADSQLLSLLAEECKKRKLTFVHGKGKRKSGLQNLFEKCEEMRNKRLEYEKALAIMGERNSYSKTDHTATFMRMKEDHMKNGQLKPAYNVQLGVQSEYIVGLGIYPNPTDTRTLVPFLKHLYKAFGIKPKHIVADAGYDSEENLGWLQANGYLSVIKPSKYEISKTRKYKTDIGAIRNMTYNAEGDYYTCAKGRNLVNIGEHDKKNHSGYVSTVTQYQCESCHYCGFRNQCQKYGSGKTNKTIQINTHYNQLLEENMERFQSPEGIRMRTNRSIQVEGAFGTIKEDFSYRRLHRRGVMDVYKELLFLALGFDIRKLANRINGNRIGLRFLDKEA